MPEVEPAQEQSAFTADDPLWQVVGIAKGTGEPVARQHDEYLYQKDDQFGQT